MTCRPVTNLPGYADLYRSFYSYEQKHRSFGQCNLIHIPCRDAGSFVEPAVAGPSLQISLQPGVGTATLNFGAGRFKVALNQPTFVLGAADVPCEYIIPHQIDLFVVEFPRAFLDETHGVHPTGAERLHTAASNDRLVIDAAQRLWTLGRAATAIEADTLAAALWFLLSHSVGADHPRRSTGGLAAWQERRATEYLGDNMADEVRLDTLAYVAGLSTFHFARQFKKSTGLAPHAYLRRLRSTRARELLASTDLSIGEIAGSVGYDTPQAFARMFRAEVGVSPSVYRRERRL